MKSLIDKLPEVYQDIVVNDEVLWSGVRSCKPRWDIIKSYISHHDVVMDVGSSLGYFSNRIASEYPDSLVVSFESEPEMCAVQKEIYRRQGTYNVVLCQHRLTVADIARWAECVSAFDVVLLLSVLHHYPEHDIPSVWSLLSSMSLSVISETPTLEETKACGSDEAKRQALFYSTFGAGYMGSSMTHLGVARSMNLTQRPHKRQKLSSYMGLTDKDRTRHILDPINGYWTLDGRNLISGVNVWNLMKFNIVWPERPWWISQARAAYECLEHKSDVRWWNLLVTSTGLKAIDYMTKFPKGDQAEFKGQEDYERLEREFT